MQQRRERILDAARNIMATEGFEGLSIRDLAKQAGVTTPTIYNLIGNKNELLEKLMEGVYERFESVQQNADLSDPLASMETLINEVAALLSQKEAFFRAAFVANDRLRSQLHQPVADGFARAVKLVENICQRAADMGLLKGEIHHQTLASHIYDSYIFSRQEWMNGSLDTEAFRKQALVSAYIGFAADAEENWRKELLGKITQLSD